MTKMALPLIPRISRSKSKGELYRALGLTEGVESHDRLYKLMMEEANAGRDRICRDPKNLNPQKQGTPGPYSASDVTETAMHAQVQIIFHCASPGTKQWYERGLLQEGPNWDNWIIRWCLWHAFRYRDSRNQPFAENGRRSRNSPYEPDSPAERPRPNPTTTLVYAVNGSYYDPVRDC